MQAAVCVRWYSVARVYRWLSPCAKGMSPGQQCVRVVLARLRLPRTCEGRCDEDLLLIVALARAFVSCLSYLRVCVSVTCGFADGLCG